MNVTFTEPDLLFTELWKKCELLDVALANILIGNVFQDIHFCLSYLELVELEEVTVATEGRQQAALFRPPF